MWRVRNKERWQIIKRYSPRHPNYVRLWLNDSIDQRQLNKVLDYRRLSGTARCRIQHHRLMNPDRDCRETVRLSVVSIRPAPRNSRRRRERMRAPAPPTVRSTHYLSLYCYCCPLYPYHDSLRWHQQVQLTLMMIQLSHLRNKEVDKCVVNEMKKRWNSHRHYDAASVSCCANGKLPAL